MTLSNDGGYLYYLDNYQKMKTISQVDTVTGERREIYKLSKNTFHAIDYFDGNLFFAGRDNPIEGIDLIDSASFPSQTYFTLKIPYFID